MAFKWMAAVAVLTASVAAGCGGSRGTLSTAGASGATAGASRTTAGASGATAGASASPAAFAWLRPGPPPPAWSLARLPGTAALAYPPSWHRMHSDPGTVSAGRLDPSSGLISEYLNATPRQADETLQNWATFRPAHNAHEGERHDHVLAAARGLRFRNGHGSCVIDRYDTSRTSYQEIACLVQGPRGEIVVVAAGLAARWAQSAPALERAVSAFVA